MDICVDSCAIDVATHPVFTCYATSRDGRVFTRPAIRRKGGSRSGAYPRADHWVEVSQFTVQPAYTPPYRKCRVTQDGKTKLVSVHRFMLECWEGVQPRSLVVRHLNGDSLDNRLDNLKYGTVKENVKDAFRHTGNYAAGEKNAHSRFTEEQVRQIRARHAAGEKLRHIHADFPFATKTAISNIYRRVTWKHVV